MSHTDSTAGRLGRCGEWIGALVTFPSFVNGEGEEPYRPTAVMWVETETGVIVDSELVRPEQALPRAAGLFHLATREPSVGAPRMPRSLRVSDETLAMALRGRLGDVELIVAPTPEIDVVVESLIDHMQKDDRETAPTHLGGDVDAEDVGAFFRAAARLFRAQPWRATPGDEFLGVSCELLGIEDGALTVVGQQGDSFGLALFRSTEDAAAFLEAAERHSAGERGVEFPQQIIVSYDPLAKQPEELRAEVREHGWPIAAGGAYPSAFMLDADLVSRGLTRVELRGLTGVLEVLAEMVERAPDLAGAWRGGEPLACSRVVAGIGTIELRAPLVADDQDDAARWTSIVNEDGTLDEARFDTHREALLAWLGAHATAEQVGYADLLIENLAGYHGITISQVTSRHLGELLFETLPKNVSVPASEAPQIVNALRVLLGFAATQLDSAYARTALAELPADAADRLATALADKRKYGMAKSIVMAGIESGYDMSTEAGVNAWLEVVNGGGFTMPRKASAKKRAAPKKRARPTKKPARARTTTTKKKSR